ncbi:hypothetical protein RFI_09062, partial [Reticulomyxa filosa]
MDKLLRIFAVRHIRNSFTTQKEIIAVSCRHKKKKKKIVKQCLNKYKNENKQQFSESSFFFVFLFFCFLFLKLIVDLAFLMTTKNLKDTEDESDAFVLVDELNDEEESLKMETISNGAIEALQDNGNGNGPALSA